MSSRTESAAKHRSYWLRDVLASESHAPCLRGKSRADVAIVGGGYVGLWTAIWIKELDPGCDVALLEQDICGAGASGRNGGIVLSWWQKLSVLARLYGIVEATHIARLVDSAVSRLAAFCKANAIDADFQQNGWICTAATQAQLEEWEDTLGICERMGIDVFQRLESTDITARIGSSGHLGGVLYPAGAIVQPAALVRGLRRVALGLGIRIYENTRVLSFTRDSPVTVKTPLGTLVTKKLVLANNAWASAISELRRALVILSSDMVVTDPIPDRLQKLGWTGGEAITDSQIMTTYGRTTSDNRIAFGKDSWTVAFAGHLGGKFDRNKQGRAGATSDFYRYYPTLVDVPIALDWAGPIDMTKNGLPLLGNLQHRQTILYGVGWSGNGIGPSMFGGRVLSSLALDRDDEWTRCPLVGYPPLRFPNEPVRFIGTHVLRKAVAQKEQSEARGLSPSWLGKQIVDASWLSGIQ